MIRSKPKVLGLTIIRIVLLTMVLGITPAASQNYPTEALTWGIKAGVTDSDFIGDDAAESAIQTKPGGGIFLNYRFDRQWGLQPEFLYTVKGAKLEDGLTGENSNATYELEYLTIPVFMKYYFLPGALVSPNLYAGPEVSFILYGHSNKANIDDELKNTEWGFAFGAGLDFSVGSKPTDLIRTVGVDLRYSLGLTNVFDTPQKPEAKNGMFMSALFLGF